MQKVLVSLTAAIITAATLAASTAPANALRRHVAGPAHVAGRVYVAPVRRAPVVVNRVPVVVAPVIVAPRAHWAAHVTYCSAKYVTYDPNTNTYVSSSGFVRTCT